MSTATSPSSAPGRAAASTVRNSAAWPSRRLSPSAMWRSVGKLSASERITRRPRLRSSAAARSLKRLTDVESATITSPGWAPTSGAIRSPTRRGQPIQSWRFQPPMRSPAPVLDDPRHAGGGGGRAARPASCRRGRPRPAAARTTRGTRRVGQRRPAPRSRPGPWSRSRRRREYHRATRRGFGRVGPRRELIRPRSGRGVTGDAAG